MGIDRRRLLAISALTGAVPAATLATPAVAAPLSTFGIDATMLGVRAGGGADQTHMLQSAIDQTAGARVPLMLGPGEYRVGGRSQGLCSTAAGRRCRRTARSFISRKAAASAFWIARRWARPAAASCSMKSKAW
jgi:hypothetical protein